MVLPPTNFNYETRNTINTVLSESSYIYVYTVADPEGGFGDLSPLNFLEVKII